MDTPNALGYQDNVTEEQVRQEQRFVVWADGARIIHWVGIALLGTFLATLVNAVPPRLVDPTWQLNLISLLLGTGASALIGALLLCVARLFNLDDQPIAKRAALVRNAATWVALGWLLLIPAQLFLGVRLINSQAGQELGQIQTFERISRAVRDANSEADLRSALAQIPNQPPLPTLTVPVEIAKANVLAQLQKTINTAKNRQTETSSQRWQTWMKEALRNILQSLFLGLGFLALGKNRMIAVPSAKGRKRTIHSQPASWP